LTYLFDKYIEFWFNNFINKDISTCTTSLNDNKLILSANRSDDFFPDFINIFWESVKQGGIIKATSIVNPNNFWKNPQTYMKLQEDLIHNRNVTIFRYFIFKADSKQDMIAVFEAHKSILELNIQKSIKVRIAIFNKDPGEYYQDVALIDDLIYAENVIGSNGEISECTCYMKCPANMASITKKKRIFTELESLSIKSELHDNPTDFFANTTLEIVKLFG
jgi:hypothetical protein